MSFLRRLLVFTSACTFFFHFIPLLSVSEKEKSNAITTLAQQAIALRNTAAAKNIIVHARKQPELFNTECVDLLVTQIGVKNDAGKLCVKALVVLLNTLRAGEPLTVIDPKLAIICAHKLDTPDQQADCAQILHNLAMKMSPVFLAATFSPTCVELIAAQTGFATQTNLLCVQILSTLAQRLPAGHLESRFTIKSVGELKSIIRFIDDETPADYAGCCIEILRLLALHLPSTTLATHFTKSQIQQLEQLRHATTPAGLKSDSTLAILATRRQGDEIAQKKSGSSEFKARVSLTKVVDLKDKKPQPFVARKAPIPPMPIISPLKQARTAEPATRQTKRPCTEKPSVPPPAVEGNLRPRAVEQLCLFEEKNEHTMLLAALTVYHLITGYTRILTAADRILLHDNLLTQTTSANAHAAAWSKELLLKLDPTFCPAGAGGPSSEVPPLTSLLGYELEQAITAIKKLLRPGLEIH